MAKLIIEVELGNDARQTVVEVKNAIEKALMRQAADPHAPFNDHEMGAIRDLSGNTVGKWEVQ